MGKISTFSKTNYHRKNVDNLLCRKDTVRHLSSPASFYSVIVLLMIERTSLIITTLNRHGTLKNKNILN